MLPENYLQNLPVEAEYNSWSSDISNFEGICEDLWERLPLSINVTPEPGPPVITYQFVACFKC